MLVETIAGWAAPAATMIAAMMIAANAGARVTGWGFLVFLAGSIGWCIVAISTDQQNLLWTNLFLCLVNAFGIWRWLGRQARYEEGGKSAARRSEARRVPSLFPLGAIPGAKLAGADGASIGVVVDGMMRCSDLGLAYVVVREGGLSGLGEQLYALSPAEIRLSEDGLSCAFSEEDLKQRTPLKPDQWPASLAEIRPTE
jgi:hypothetical protein